MSNKSKPLVFISHINEEKIVALTFKNLVESNFLGMIDFFVASDQSSIQLGQNWLDSVTNALKSCVIEIIICSPKSVQRPWINFEAGAGWIRDVPIIPLCHSGIEPSKLPLPLNLLQAVKATDVASLNSIMPILAQAIDSITPKIDFTNFIETVTKFEENYMFWDECNYCFQRLNNFDCRIVQTLKQLNTIPIQLTETGINLFNDITKFLSKNNILRFDKIGNTTMTPDGVYYGCEIKPMHKLSDVIKDSRFKF